MTSLNWERAAEQERYRRVPREKISSSCKTKKISNAQKKLISAMTKERGMKWDNEINSLSRNEASLFIEELKRLN